MCMRVGQAGGSSFLSHVCLLCGLLEAAEGVRRVLGSEGWGGAQSDGGSTRGWVDGAWLGGRAKGVGHSKGPVRPLRTAVRVGAETLAGQSGSWTLLMC